MRECYRNDLRTRYIEMSKIAILPNLDEYMSIELKEDVYYYLSELKNYHINTYYHCIDVGLLSYAIASKLNLSKSNRISLFIAGVLHDIGKIKCPLGILNKQTKLDEKEFELMKRHTYAGYIITRGAGYSKNIAQLVLQHHEKINGKGYPWKLKKKGIKKNSLILSIADIYMALIHKRAYKEDFSKKKALSILSTSSVNDEYLDTLKSILL